MSLPEEIRAAVNGRAAEAVTIGCLGAYVFRLEGWLCLKREPAGRNSARERDMLLWLRGRPPVPEVTAAARAMARRLCEGAAALRGRGRRVRGGAAGV